MQKWFFLLLFSKCLNIFLVSFFSWFLVWFHCDCKNTFHSFKYFKLVDICFMAQEMVYLVDHSMAIAKKIMPCWIVYFVKCQLNPGGLMILLSSSITLQIFCRAVLLVTERGVLKSLPIIMDLSNSPFNSTIFCSFLYDNIYLGLPHLFGGLIFYHYIMSVSGNFLSSEVDFIWY